MEALQQALMAVGQAAYGGNGHGGPDGANGPGTPTPEGAVEGEYREV
jgi:hypothetical protein